MPLSVTFLTGEYPPMQGGIADYTAHLATHLQAIDVRTQVLISERYRSFGHIDQLPLSTVPVYPNLSNWGWRSWHQIPQFWRQHPSDIIHIQYQAAAFELKGWINGLPWWLRRRSHRPKVVTTFHDLRIPYLFPKAGSLRQQAVLTLARHSDAVICTNADDAAALQQHAWARHVHEIPLGHNLVATPPKDFDRAAWRNKLGFGDGDFVLAYFGFLNESKGGDALIDTLARLRAADESVYLLMIGGETGDSDLTNRIYAEYIQQRIDSAGLDPYVVRSGYVTAAEVSAHLLAADAALFPFRDGVSFRRTSLLAALAHGLPVISTLPPSAAAATDLREQMLLAPVDDVPALTALVQQLIAGPAMRQDLAEASRRLSVRFAWPDIARRTRQVYEQCLGGAAGRPT